MNIVRRIIRKIKYLKSGRYIRRQASALQKKLETPTSSRRIYLFCAPIHSNLGDQAQLMCWLRLFAQWYPEHEVMCVPTRFRCFLTLRTIHRQMKDGDMVFVHSGYLIFDLHPELPFILDVLRAFYDKKIVILPQTVNLMDSWLREVVARTFNAHDNLTLLCRDEVSFSKAKEIFPKVTLRLMPDVVTSLIGDKSFIDPVAQRSGVMICVRNDVEKLYTDEQIESLRKKFRGVRTTMSDTSIKASVSAWKSNRETLIRDMLDRFAQYQVVITDRYHGTIFSAIVNTPVIVLSSTDHKLSSGVNWFAKEGYGSAVQYATSLDDAYAKAQEIIRNHTEVSNSPHFAERYWGKPL